MNPDTRLLGKIGCLALNAFALGLAVAALIFVLWRDYGPTLPRSAPDTRKPATVKGRPASVDSGATGDVPSVPARLFEQLPTTPGDPADEVTLEVYAAPSDVARWNSIRPAADESRTAPYRTGRPPGMRLPRIEPPAPQCVWIEWRWATVAGELVNGPVTMRMLSGIRVARAETRDHFGLLSELRFAVTLPRGEFFGREWNAEARFGDAIRLNGEPSVNFEAECEGKE